MTAAAIDYRADRVCIASDSRVYDDVGTTLGAGTKVFSVPHLRCVFFSRGRSAVTIGVLARVMLEPTLFTIENLAEAMPDILRGTVSDWCDEMGSDPPTGIYHESVWFGWSEAEERMRCFQWWNSDNFVTHSEPDRRYGAYSWPAIPAESLPPDRSTDSTETKLSGVLKAIDTWAADNAALPSVGGARLGGDMMMCTLTEAAIDNKIIGTFDPPAAAPRTDGKAARDRAQRQARKTQRRKGK
jgi:hypothetical protein